jgi:hypothetical protein
VDDFQDVYPSVPQPQPIDLQVLNFVLDSFEERPWAIKELLRLGDPEDILESVHRLVRYGHVQFISNYVVATRAAIYFYRLQRFNGEPTTDGLTGTHRRRTA